MFNNTKLLEKMRADQTAWLQRQRAERFRQTLAVLEGRQAPHQFEFPVSGDWEHLHGQGLLLPMIQPLPAPRPVHVDRPLWTRVRRWPHTSMMFLDRPGTAAIMLRQGVVTGDTMPFFATPVARVLTLEERIAAQDDFDAETTRRRQWD